MAIRPALACSAILAAACYAALTIYAYGGISAFFAEAALCALLGVLVLLTVLGLATQGNLDRGEREAGERPWVWAAFGLITLAAAVLPPYADRYGIWTMGGEAVRWLGVAVFAAGGLLRLWPVFVLGRRFSGRVAIQPGHTLVTTGIYGKIRHPSYLGLLVGMLGWGLAFRSPVMGLLLVAGLLVPLVARMRTEEALLLAHFGQEYSAYCRRTRRLIPGLY